LIISSAALGCKPKIPEPEAVQPAATPAERAEPKPGVSPEAAEKPKPKEGWREVSQQNNLPLCVFGSASEREKVTAPAQVKKQVLRGDLPIVFGVFAPHCINPKCHELSTLQCSVERSGNTLRLQTRYLGFHKDGTTCREDCRDATAGCASPVLEPGEYTLEYGGTEIPLKIPSSINMPCFKPS
jgi:hypothetical protein